MEQMTLYDIAPTEAPPAEAWLYDEDNSFVMCRCPKCGGRLMISFYTYWNPYHYCPYCGIKLAEGRLVAKMVTVYGHEIRVDAWQPLPEPYMEENNG